MEVASYQACHQGRRRLDQAVGHIGVTQTGDVAGESLRSIAQQEV